MLPAACFHVDCDKLNKALGNKCHCPQQRKQQHKLYGSVIHNAASETETASSVFEHQGHQLLSHQGKRRCKCRLGGATCPSSALCTPVYPPNGAGYLRVVLWEEVSPVCRRGDAYDKYSLDCEEAENTVRLRADRHFPLNIQETGINKRRTGRAVSHS